LSKALEKLTKSLASPINDANSVAETLEKLNFSVIKVINRDYSKIRVALRSFNSSGRFRYCFIYYAGHGENWLIPVDAELISN